MSFDELSQNRPVLWHCNTLRLIRPSSPIGMCLVVQVCTFGDAGLLQKRLLTAAEAGETAPVLRLLGSDLCG